MLTFRFSGICGVMTVPEQLTSGMVGKQLLLEFSPEWDSLRKTVVFSNGSIVQDVVFTGGPVTIPAGVLEKPLKRLLVGVYGVSADGKVVIPTIRAEGPTIQPSVDPSGDLTADPDLPVWAQLQVAMGSTEDLQTDARDSLVSAINELAGKNPGTGSQGGNGATFTPSVSADGVLSWTNDGGLENPEPVSIMGPKGDTGESPEVTAYAIDGGNRIQVIANSIITHFDVLDGAQGSDGYGIFTTPENAPVDTTYGENSEFALSEVRIPTGRSLRPEDLLLMENGWLLFRVNAVDTDLGTVSAGFLGSLRGNSGTNGYSPVRGTDYWTEADIAEIKSYVDEAILGGAW